MTTPRRLPPRFLIAIVAVALLVAGVLIVGVIPFVRCTICKGTGVLHLKSEPRRDLPCPECAARGRRTLWKHWTGWADDFRWMENAVPQHGSTSEKANP